MENDRIDSPATVNAFGVMLVRDDADVNGDRAHYGRGPLVAAYWPSHGALAWSVFWKACRGGVSISYHARAASVEGACRAVELELSGADSAALGAYVARLMGEGEISEAAQ